MSSTNDNCNFKQKKIINGKEETICGVQICHCNYKGNRLDYDRNYNRTYSVCLE